MIHNQQQQQQQQTSKAMMSNNINKTKPAPSLTYATTTQEAIERYTFVPVFESTEDIQAPSSATDKSKLELTKPSKGQVPWCCIECDAETFGHKCTCCGRPRETGALRVFVGKLNREGSAEMTNAMLQTMLSNPSQDLSGPVLHIEPHTHASNGRGKGCTWIYVRSAKDVKTIVDAFHHRTFIAVHPTSGEVGFVPFPASCDEAEIESIFQHDHDNRQRFVHYLLHRGRVTAEIPESMQQDVFAKLNGSFVGKFPGKVYHNNNQQHQNSNNQDFVAPSYANPMKPAIDASHTQQMMHYVNHQAPAYNAQMANMMMANIPQGFQQQILPPPPPPFPMNNNNSNMNNMNNNNNNAASVALSPKPYQAPTGVSPMTPLPPTNLPPRPELATSSWYQEDSDNEDNHFGTSSDDELQQQQSSATSTPTNQQKTTCKQACNRGRRYMWNPY